VRYWDVTDRMERELVRAMAREAAEQGTGLRIAPRVVLGLLEELERTEEALRLMEALWSGVWMVRVVRWVCGIGRKGNE